MTLDDSNDTVDPAEADRQRYEQQQRERRAARSKHKRGHTHVHNMAERLERERLRAERLGLVGSSR